MMKGLGSLERFFGRVDVVGKPSSAVLPVFFGNKHACLVDKLGLEIMKELNPQVGTKLQVVAASEPYADNVLCLSKDGWASETHKQNTIRALAELHLEPAGQQILTLFKVVKLAPFQEQHMDTVKKLRMRYEKLRTEHDR
jgi:ABC-type phosphate/phosphonate transport system substrate-binding protein